LLFSLWFLKITTRSDRCKGRFNIKST
jgi:hypothetical protein